MSCEKSGIPTHNDEAVRRDNEAIEIQLTDNEDDKEDSTSTGETTTLRAKNSYKNYVQALCAGCSSSILILVHRRLRGQLDESRLRQNLSQFQTAIPIPKNLRISLRASSSHESLITALVVLLGVYWYCIATLLAQQRWKDRYLPWICGMGLPSLLIGAWLVQDSTTLFVEIFVIIIDVSVVGCLLAELFIG